MSMRDWTTAQRMEYIRKGRETKAAKRQAEIDHAVAHALRALKDNIFSRIAIEGLDRVGVVITEEFERAQEVEDAN